MKEVFIKTRNYIKMYDLMSTLVELDGNKERMGLAFGKYGLGKTFSLERIAVEFNAVLLRTDQTWTVSSVLKILARELGIDERGKASELMERIINTMIFAPRPIIVDEIDTLLPAPKFGVLELLRDLHDETGNIFLMVGMETCDARLKNHSHFYSRIVGLTKFEDMPIDDVRAFCRLCGIGKEEAWEPIEIEEDVVKHFANKYKNLRLIKVYLLRLERWCEVNGIDTINMKLLKQSGVEYAEK